MVDPRDHLGPNLGPPSMPQIDLTDEETAALVRVLRDAIDADRYPLSPRVQRLKGILNKLKPEPVREPLPPLKHYEPPSKGRYRRRG
jgi:hypothetical protein